MSDRKFTPWPAGQTPATWPDVAWPDWVPSKVIAQIEEFWLPQWHRGPKDYEECASSSYNNAPDFGERVSLSCGGREFHEGRYVHYANNMGRVIADDGTVHVVSTNEYFRDPAKRAAFLNARVAKQRKKVERARAALAEEESRLAESLALSERLANVG